MKLHQHIIQRLRYILLHNDWEKCMFGFTIKTKDYTIRVWKKKPFEKEINKFIKESMRVRKLKGVNKK